MASNATRHEMVTIVIGSADGQQINESQAGGHRLLSIIDNSSDIERKLIQSYILCTVVIHDLNQM